MLYKECLLVSDIDGTLMTHQEIIPKKNILAIERFIQEGGLFSVSTGRTPSSIQQVAPDIPMNCPAIVCNGTSIYDFHTKQTLWQAFLPTEAHDDIRDAMERYPTAAIYLHADQKDHLVNARKGFPQDMLEKGLNKVVICDRSEVIADLERHMLKKKRETHDFVKSMPFFLEILPKGVEKGSTLLKLAQMKGISLDKTFAIGDYYNDFGMIKTAAHSAAVPTAPEELLRVAGYVTVPCEDGAVADFIEHIGRLPGV